MSKAKLGSTARLASTATMGSRKVHAYYSSPLPYYQMYFSSTHTVKLGTPVQGYGRRLCHLPSPKAFSVILRIPFQQPFINFPILSEVVTVDLYSKRVTM